MNRKINPIIKMDYPDPDVIRVDDTYYMVSTTMYFMPGGALLKSYDLEHWELVGYLFETLDDTPEERMELEKTEYAGGMWAPSVKYHDGMFYVFFLSHSGNRNYLFKSAKFEGPWEKTVVEGYYHDASLLFDGERRFVVHGNREIRITELDKDLTGPKKGGLDRVILTDGPESMLGYEGAHIYKIGKYYYLFLINWPKNGVRTQNCFRAESLEGEFTGGPVLTDTMELKGRGVAQGGIVDTPDGDWYAVLFQDVGAVGRIPVLVPVTWKDDFPVFGVDGKIPTDFKLPAGKHHKYKALYASDNFVPSGSGALNPVWQWNHSPDNNLWRLLPEGGLEITTGKICVNLTHARNTLTQRMLWPQCSAEVTIDASRLNDGDVAGLCALQSSYGMIGIKKEHSAYYLVVVVRDDAGKGFEIGAADYMPGNVIEKIELDGPVIRVGLKADLNEGRDLLDFYYKKENRPVKVGETHKLEFKLTHFTGNRFGLCCYSTRVTGGSAVFTKFDYMP